ncbi:hypothetical protein CLAFUW4_10704 [Fulvia fulva]|nr:hypothetical protein CLAFUR4_10709 [Fulvia fulva]WPV19701.1 hypothetical protein CLAFUW4_10704 [Fulvia fulva]WPV33781.1 hypothetical protein CLAFUW7_10706 [Fulvia fulva]
MPPMSVLTSRNMHTIRLPHPSNPFMPARVPRHWPQASGSVALAVQQAGYSFSKTWISPNISGNKQQERANASRMERHLDGRKEKQAHREYNKQNVDEPSGSNTVLQGARSMNLPSLCTLVRGTLCLPTAIWFLETSLGCGVRAEHHTPTMYRVPPVHLTDQEQRELDTRRMQQSQMTQNWTLYIVSFKCSRVDVFYLLDNTGLTIRDGDMVKFEAIYPASLTVLRNIAPYQSNLARATSTKMQDMFQRMCSAEFICKTESAGVLISEYLDAINSVLANYYQGEPPQ